MKAYLYVVLLLLVIFGAIGGYLYQRFSALAAKDFAPPPVTIAVSTAVAETWTETLNAVGTIQAVRGVELTTETSGEVTAINFSSGQLVAANELLVIINDEVEQASLRNQEATLELAQILYERDSRLIAKKSIPQSQYDRSRADLQRAQAQLAETKARLENKRIEAPFAGRIGISRIDVGDYVEPGTVIATLQDSSELEIDFTVPARYANQLRPGLQAELRVDAYPDRSFQATVSAVDARIDPATRNILVRAQVAAESGLVPGMFAAIALDLGNALDVVTVPETALTYSLQGDIIYVVQTADDGKLTAVPRVVQTGKVLQGRVAIYGGLDPGDRVVSVGQNKLYRGVRVVIDESVKL